MIRSFRRSIVAWASCVALTSTSALAGGVRIVERTGQSNFADIGSAVAAASEGDVLIVGAGTYPSFTISGKSVSIFAIPSGAATIHGTVTVSALSSDQVVVLNGLEVLGHWGGRQPALLIAGCAGHVRVDGCVLEGRSIEWAAFRDYVVPGESGAGVFNSSRVVFTRCQAVGGHGAGLDDQSDCCDLTSIGRGGNGIESTNSTLVLYDCSATGGEGGATECSFPGTGGDGLALTNSRAFASVTPMRGGPGGYSLQWPPSSSGAGGPGVRFSGQSSLSEVGCTFAGGFTNTPPSIGGTPTTLPGPARVASILPSAGGDQGSWSCAFQGANADQVWAYASSEPDFRFALALRGAWLLRRGSLQSTPFAGTANPIGVLAAAIGTPDLAPGPLDPIHRVFFSQITVRSSASPLVQPPYLPAFDRLGSPATLLLVDRASDPDCDGNGLNDFVQVIESPSQDANHNLIPDICPGG